MARKTARRVKTTDVDTPIDSDYIVPTVPLTGGLGAADGAMLSELAEQTRQLVSRPVWESLDERDRVLAAIKETEDAPSPLPTEIKAKRNLLKDYRAELGDIERRLGLQGAYAEHSKGDGPEPGQDDEDGEQQHDYAAVRQGLPTSEIASALDGLNGWNAPRWRHELQRAQWLTKCRVRKGAPGKSFGGGYSDSLYDPLAVGKALLERQAATKHEVLRVFRRESFEPWREALKEYIATYYPTSKNGR